MPMFLRLPAVLVLLALAAVAQVHVRGYVRRDGTYVQPHYRSNPDGNFNNNWSTKGNINPYTGEPGTRVTPPSGSAGGSGYDALRDYYRSVGPVLGPMNGPSPSSTRVPWRAPAGISKLPALTGALPDEEVLRSDKYCGWLYEPDDLSVGSCRNQQHQVLASIVLPDYSGFPQAEVIRSGRYCEWLYGDNRASFYDCLNGQILGLARAEATFSPRVPDSESARSKQYCEWLYGDNRASYRECMATQALQLQSYWPISAKGLPGVEWQRSQRYCDWLYENNRGSAFQCLHERAQALRQYSEAGIMSKALPEKARSYCEWLYTDNRASYWNCIAARQ